MQKHSHLPIYGVGLIYGAWVRQKPHDLNAPYDAYDESEDTEEKHEASVCKSKTGSEVRV